MTNNLMTQKILRRVREWEWRRIIRGAVIGLGLAAAAGAVFYAAGAEMQELGTYELMTYVSDGWEVAETVWQELPKETLVIGVAAGVVLAIVVARKWPVIRRKLGYLLKSEK